jgi:hypothetical protein
VEAGIEQRWFKARKKKLKKLQSRMTIGPRQNSISG